MKPEYYDAIVDGAYTGLVFLAGYMTLAGSPVLPSRAALAGAVVTGCIGALNQLRALRKRP